MINYSETEPDPQTGNPQTIEIFTDANGNTTTTHTTIAIDRAHGHVFETETGIDPDGNETITQTVTAPDGAQRVDVCQSDGTVTTTETWPNGAQSVTENQLGSTTTTVTQPNGTTVESVSYDDGTTVKTVNYPNGDTTMSVSEMVTDPQTGMQGQVTTVINTTTNSQGLPTLTEIVDDPLNGIRTIIETVNNTDWSQTVTTVVTDTSGQNILSSNSYTTPPAGSTAGPSTASTSAGSSK